jgi:preprotein translocase subunit SecE
VSEDRDQDRVEERDAAARPVTAAARRERRASAAAARDGVAAKARPSGKSSAARPRGGRAVADDSGKTTLSKAELGIETQRRDGREKRPNVFKRLARFIREVVGELRKVIWPTRRQQLTYTVVVLVFVAFIVALVAGLDALFAKGVFWVFA